MNHKFPYKWYLKDGYPAKNGYKVFSCFACGGGSTMGYKLAGYEVLGANEIDIKVAECYQVNHNPKHLFIEPIQEFKNRQYLPDELFDLDILDGSPPCSSFSMAGNREKDWGKEKVFREGQAKQVLDTLFFDFIDVAERLQPKIVIAENVKGLIQGAAKEYVWRIYQAFDKAGYYVHKWLLDASKMGVPQRRERVFFVAIRKDLANKIDCAWKIDLFNPMPHLDMEFDEAEILFKTIKSPGKRKPIQAAIKKAYDYCIEYKVSDFGIYFSKVNGKRKYFTIRLIWNNRICDTIKSQCTHVIEGEKAYINETELKLAGSYPLDYKFVDCKTDYLVGMSVPPIMTAQIASRIQTQWLDKMTI